MINLIYNDLNLIIYEVLKKEFSWKYYPKMSLTTSLPPNTPSNRQNNNMCKNEVNYGNKPQWSDHIEYSNMFYPSQNCLLWKRIWNLRIWKRWAFISMKKDFYLIWTFYDQCEPFHILWSEIICVCGDCSVYVHMQFNISTTWFMIR